MKRWVITALALLAMPAMLRRGGSQAVGEVSQLIQSSPVPAAVQMPVRARSAPNEVYRIKPSEMVRDGMWVHPTYIGGIRPY